MVLTIIFLIMADYCKLFGIIKTTNALSPVRYHSPNSKK